MPESLRASFDFLRDLANNNTKAWFDAHRKQYETARENFEAFVTELILGVGEFDDMSGVVARDCMFRINRDVRFSKDKSPYKTNFGAVIGKGGRKAEGRSYYIQFAPGDQSFLAGGLYQPSSVQLEKMRRRLADNAKAFKRIINAADFKQYFEGVKGETLKTAPQGYAKDHPEIELLRHKQFMAWHSLTDADLLKPDVQAHIVAVFKAMEPFVSYLDETIND